ncbi:VTT domain-containing protein [Loigolactobacillus binensis]|uniref:VTT domain-containing protein n=1 Tax=Loigolactobacillus binensis TaxID=2559922 RepID=A0ABW3EDN9_9LACO|nr:VTT domain-containing protein [Loigolactobacillus binensis]
MKKATKLTLYCVSTIIVLLLIGYLYIDFHTDVTTFLNAFEHNHELRHDIQRHQNDPLIMALLVISIGLMAAIPFLPISVFCIIIGGVYGVYFGGLINLLGIALGNSLVLVSLRYTHLSHKLQTHPMRFIDKIAQRGHPLIGLTIGYGVPALPTIFVNLMAIHLQYKPKQLIGPILIGSAPVAFVYAFGGDLFSNGNIMIGILVLLLLTLSLIVFFKRTAATK